MSCFSRAVTWQKKFVRIFSFHRRSGGGDHSHFGDEGGYLVSMFDLVGYSRYYPNWDDNGRIEGLERS